jgi:hypothetical protein
MAFCIVALSGGRTARAGTQQPSPSDSLRQHYLVQVLRVHLSPSHDERPCLSIALYLQEIRVLSSYKLSLIVPGFDQAYQYE